MAKNKTKIEDYTPSPFDDIRKELDGKIDKRVPNHLFYWILGGIVTIFILSFGYIHYVDEKINTTNISLTELKTKLNTKIEDKKI